MLVEISKGELIDKITILEIKDEKITEPEKLKNVRHELDTIRKLEFPTPIKEKLMEVNRRLWDVEDDLRLLEKEGKFDDEFVKKARSVYKLNDERSRLKKTINIEQGSNFVEEKSYT
jgi:predicted transcriptional regulator